MKSTLLKAVALAAVLTGCSETPEEVAERACMGLIIDSFAERGFVEVESYELRRLYEIEKDIWRVEYTLDVVRKKNGSTYQDKSYDYCGIDFDKGHVYIDMKLDRLKSKL